MPSTSTPEAFLADLAQRGFTVSVSAGSILVAPASRLTPDDRDVLRERRGELLAVLSQIEPWDTATAIQMIFDADTFVASLGVNGQHPAITATVAKVASAHANRNMKRLRFALAEFTKLAQTMAAERRSERETSCSTRLSPEMTRFLADLCSSLHSEAASRTND